MTEATNVLEADSKFDAECTETAARPKLCNPARVLLVEDCDHTRALISHRLSQLGLKVTAAADGESFMEHALESEVEGKPFDLVLLDINLPKLNGVEATRLLRKAGYDRPIIAITAGPTLQDRNDSLYAGCDNFLAKGELHHTLVPTLSEYLNLRMD